MSNVNVCLVCPGLSWSVLVCFGLSWSVLVCLGLSWSVLVSVSNTNIYIQLTYSGICDGRIFLPSRCHFFSTLTANYDHFLYASTAFNWLPWSIMSAGPGKSNFWTPAPQVGTFFRFFYCCVSALKSICDLIFLT